MTGRCTRCKTRCVVDPELACLSCGHVARPANDRDIPLASNWGLATLVPYTLAPTEQDGHADEEAV